jgi:hypothetical protein
MELNMHFTFDRNESFLAVGNGSYSNIRFLHTNRNPAPFDEPAWVVNSSAIYHSWTQAEHGIWNGGRGPQCGPMSWPVPGPGGGCPSSRFGPPGPVLGPRNIYYCKSL